MALSIGRIIMAELSIPAHPLGSGLTLEVKGRTAIITVDLTGDYGQTSSGNISIATSGGFVLIPGTQVKLSVNAIQTVAKSKRH
jgi:hypothetical protein